MPDLLFELHSEEIPARMQAGAADSLRRLVTDALVERGLLYEGAKAIATPRRLALVVQGLPVRQPDVREEKRGPRVGAPDAAVQGFLRSAGLADIAQARIERDPKKGEFYVATLERPGRPTLEVLAELLPEVIRAFPWPKSMRWGAGHLRWVRPLHAIVATFGPDTEDPDIVPFEVDGIAAGDTTYGHRFLAPGAIKVKRWADYLDKLEKAKVVADPERRKAIILGDAQTLAFAQGYELVEDAALLDEVAGLVEWPVVLMGRFDPAFLAIPPEVIRSTIRANQKCFVLRRAAPFETPAGRAPQGEVVAPHREEPRRGVSEDEEARGADSKGEPALADRFLLVSNLVASDGGQAIVAGNERVIRARLADAKFFYDSDLARRLEERLPKLDGIVFHQKLGSQGARVERLVGLAGRLAPLVGADVAKAERAALLAKADLVTEVVGEFPELQGLMGRTYARHHGEDQAVAAAIEAHYRPLGPADRVPRDPVAIAVALADKIDTLMGFWVIGETPTGSKDPFALRRAALGAIRIVLENGLRLNLVPIFHEAEPEGAQRERPRLPEQFGARVVSAESVMLLDFFADRLKVLLRDQGARHDLVDAVFALEDQDDLVLVVRRIEALGRFLETDDGRSLLAGYRRAANILRIEEKKDKTSYAGPPDAALLREHGEEVLAAAIEIAATEARSAVAREDFEAAMAALTRLRAPVDAFFDSVTVNVDDAAVRANRLRLLNEIRAATRTVADFSKIEGG